MEDFLGRLNDEFHQLSGRMSALEKFIGSPTFETLAEHHKALLQAQLGAMSTYLTILKIRLELLRGERNDGEI